MSNILILGIEKTGTTALYDRVKQAVLADRPTPYLLFEPVSPEPFEALRLLSPDRPIVTKVMLRGASTCRVEHSWFEHRVMTVRDPRDTIISRLLFRPLIRSSMAAATDGRLDRFLEAVRRKEADPSAVSVRELSELADTLRIGSSALRPFSAVLAQQVEMAKNLDFHSSRYEDFVSGDVADLAEYLGRDLAVENRETSGWLGHIARSLGAGEWRHWFTESDIEYFRPLVADFVEFYGYDDWDLADAPVIDSRYASGYIERKLADRQRQVAARYQTAVDADLDEADLEPLVAMADDGDRGACIRLARVHSDPNGRVIDMDRARHFARHAALQGSVDGAELMAEWSDGIDERFWRSIADVWRTAGHDSSSGSRTELRRQQRRLRECETSLEFRAGTALVDAVRAPGRNTVALPVRLWRLARERRRRDLE